MESVPDFSKRIRMASHNIEKKKAKLMIKVFILKVFEPNTISEAVENTKNE